MESRFGNFLLIIIAASTLYSQSAFCADPALDNTELKPVVQPDIERIEFDESKIKSTDFEIIGSLGVLSIEDFGTNTVLGIKLGYHISDDFFVGAEIGKSRGGNTSYENLSGGAPLLSNDERKLTYYLLTVGYNILPGEAFVTDKLTYNSALYLIGGMGSTEFAGDNRFTMNIGVGYRVLVSNYLSLYTDFRDNFFNLDVLGEDKLTNNLQLTVGAGYYF